MSGISSTLSTSNIMSAIERDIRSCYQQLSTASVETINERAWQIGKRLLDVETNLKAKPITDPEVLTDLESLQGDLRTLTTRISIAMRKQGKTPLASAPPAPIMRWQAMAERLKEAPTKETRGQFLESAKQVKHNTKFYRLAEELQDRQTKEARKMFIEAAKSKPADQKKREPRERQKISTETLGNKWLVDMTAGRTFSGNRMDPRYDQDRRDFLELGVYRPIINSCYAKDNWDLSVHFPDRTLTAYDVAGCTALELLRMPSETYYSLVDLIDPKVAMEIIKYKHYEERIEALYLFNPRFASQYALEIRELSSVPVEEPVKQAADAALKAYKGSFSPEQFVALETHSEYPKLIDAMKSQSETLITETGDSKVRARIHKNWDELNQTYMADGLRQPITPDFIARLNTAIRKAGPELLGDNPDSLEELQLHAMIQKVEGGRGLGYRVHRQELNLGYLPQRVALREVNRYCDWINAEIAACDRGEKNPILIATAACQRLVSIHPFSNGNGRTARFIADLILRRYGILPSGWKTEKIPVFPYPVFDVFSGCPVPPVTPTIAVQRMLEGLANSYALVGQAAKTVAADKQCK